MLELKNLNISFGNNHVLKDINLNVDKGDIIAIIGPSGTGKSTLLRCINYLEKPSSGTIKIGDFYGDFKTIQKKDILNLRKHSSMVFQSYNLFANMTVLQNVMEPMVTVKKIKKNIAREKSKELLDLVGLINKINEYPSMLSGGQKQRVAIARAMAVSPDIILFDEPTSALDPELVEEVENVIKKLADKKKTMILVTHEINFARSVANKAIFMCDGKIIESGNSNKVLFNPDNERTKRFLKK